MKCHISIQLSIKVCHIFTKNHSPLFFFFLSPFFLFPFVTHCLIFHFSISPPIVFCKIYTPAITINLSMLNISQLIFQSACPSSLGTASIVCFYLVYEWDAEIFGCLPSVRKILLGRYSGSLSSESEPRMPTRFRLPAAALPGAATTLFSFSEPELRSTRGVSSTFFKIILLILHTL